MSKESDLLADVRGRQNEQIALSVARILHIEGVDPIDSESPPPELTAANSSDDMEGIDLWVPTHDGNVGIQIKSSTLYAEEFIKKHPNGKVIPVVIIGEHSNIESIKRDLLSAIKWAHAILFSDT